MVTFNIRQDYDLLLIPFSPASESDRLEARAQVKSENGSGYIDVAFYLDGDKEKNLIGVKKDLFVEEGKWGFANCYLNLAGKAGEHSIMVKLVPNAKTPCKLLNDKAVTPLTVRKFAPNLLEGGFIMFGPPNDRFQTDTFRADTKAMTDQNWCDLIDEYNKIGQKLIIITVTVQHLRLERGSGPLVAHYNSKYYPKSDIAADDPIGAVLKTAQKNGQKVVVGLGHSYGHKLPNTFEVMQELHDLYGNYTSFYGWYDSREEGITYPSDPEWDWGWTWELWQDKRRFADTLSPVKPILFSPNTIGGNRESYVESGIHKDILQGIREGKSGWNILVPQDTIGQRRRTTDRLPHTLKQINQHFSALLDACNEGGIHLWANCEGFNFDDAFHLYPRFDGGGMDGEVGFVQQITTLRKYSEKVITFMFNGFFAPPDFKPIIGGEKATKQYNDYMTYAKSPYYAFKNHALGKPYTLSAMPDKKFPDCNYSATDGVLYGGNSFDTDLNRTFAYYVAPESMLSVEMVIDLGENKKIDKLCYYENKNAVYAPNKMKAWVSDDGVNYSYFGLATTYSNGKADLYCDREVTARYVKLGFIKQNPVDQLTWLFIDEVEVLEKYC